MAWISESELEVSTLLSKILPFNVVFTIDSRCTQA